MKKNIWPILPVLSSKTKLKEQFIKVHRSIGYSGNYCGSNKIISMGPQSSMKTYNS